MAATTGEDGALRLDDGRTLAWTTYGDPAGTVVVSCHGGLSSRRDVSSADDAARAAGVRVVAPDRPGVGGSSRLAGRTLLGWADDVAALLDHLEVADAAALGWSAGGQYALALGRALPERIRRVAVLAGAVPLDWPGALDELNAMDRRLVHRSRTRPAAMRVQLGLTRTVARHLPGMAEKQTRRSLGPADAAVLDGPAGRALVADMADGLRDLHGAVDEYLVFGAPWGFEPDEVTVPVRLWQGDQDRLVPPPWAERLAARLPDAEVTACPGAGHLVGRGRWPEVLAWCAG